jgi:hypothetical protein
MNISIIGTIYQQYAACRTDECKQAKSNWLNWEYGEYLPFIRADLARHNPEQLALVDEMVSIYKPLPAWPKRVHLVGGGTAESVRELYWGKR